MAQHQFRDGGSASQLLFSKWFALFCPLCGAGRGNPSPLFCRPSGRHLSGGWGRRLPRGLPAYTGLRPSRAKAVGVRGLPAEALPVRPPPSARASKSGCGQLLPGLRWAPGHYFLVLGRENLIPLFLPPTRQAPLRGAGAKAPPAVSRLVRASGPAGRKLPTAGVSRPQRARSSRRSRLPRLVRASRGAVQLLPGLRRAPDHLFLIPGRARSPLDSAAHFSRSAAHEPSAQCRGGALKGYSTAGPVRSSRSGARPGRHFGHFPVNDWVLIKKPCQMPKGASTFSLPVKVIRVTKSAVLLEGKGWWNKNCIVPISSSQPDIFKQVYAGREDDTSSSATFIENPTSIEDRMFNYGHNDSDCQAENSRHSLVRKDGPGPSSSFCPAAEPLYTRSHRLVKLLSKFDDYLLN
ncbi:hypothetical protein NDU88_006213 [Pleurodeles waltl]|uniref:Uncharacterized protein n=1 Tax=Pleurodeles waltl TaxID=8319 RepID=A0AAV7LRB7_PLEWA|nr:hypothetical protein NDU88_006213 [Pleurodeles waltl]